MADLTGFIFLFIQDGRSKMADTKMTIFISNTSSNLRLGECVRLVALYQTANTSGSQVVTKEMKAFESFAFPYMKAWL